MFTCKFVKGLEVGCDPTGRRLNRSTPSRGKTHSRVTIQTSEWGGIPAAGLGLRVGDPSSGVSFTLPSGDFVPSVEL